MGSGNLSGQRGLAFDRAALAIAGGADRAGYENGLVTLLNRVLAEHRH